MRRLFNLLQWSAFFGLVAWLVWGVTRPVAPPDYDRSSWNSWDGFLAISYAGVPRQRDGRYIDRRGLAEHIAALRAAGYHTIRPEDAAAFLAGRAPLPDQALLILFEGGRKDSFLAATPPLRKAGFVATIGLPTGLLERWGSFHLRKGDLKKVLADPHWNVASMGRNAYRLAAAGPQGAPGPSLALRQVKANRPESDEEFKARVAADYEAAARSLGELTGTRPAAYLAPYAGGARVEQDALAPEANRAAAAQHHQIAFTRFGTPFNTQESEPFALARLHVDGTWTGEELVRELKRAVPRVDNIAGVRQAEWITEGPARVDGGVLRLADRGRAWLQAPAAWPDLEISATVARHGDAVVSLVVRHNGPESLLRVTLAKDGLRVQERAGPRTQTLAARLAPSPDGTAHELLVRVKGNRIWVSDRGELVGGAALPLSRTAERGRIGLDCDEGNAELVALAARPIRPFLVFSRDVASHPASAQARITGMLPDWFDSEGRTELGDAQRAVALRAATEGIETIPVLKARPDLRPDDARALAARVASALERPETRTLITRIAVRGTNRELTDGMRRHGYRVVGILTPQEALALLQARPSELPVDSLMVEGPEPQARQAVERLLHVYNAKRLILALETPGLNPQSATAALGGVTAAARGMLP